MMTNDLGICPHNSNVTIDVPTAVAQMGGRMALVMIGGQVVQMGESDRFYVTIKARNAVKITMVTIVLMADDTYTLQFWTGRGTKMRLIPTLDLEGVYCDQLKGCIEKRTGLYLSL